MPTETPIEPIIVERADQTYVGMRRSITMDTFNEVTDRIPELLGWLDEKRTAPSGPPFLKFNVIDMERELEVEAGVPVDDPIFDEDPVFVGVLPAGRYVSYTHRGHPDGLVPVTRDVLAWADREGLTWDMTDVPEGQKWGCRLISSLTDPAIEPDMNNWDSELLFRLAD
jgi:effector-binding domain-containing protein